MAILKIISHIDLSVLDHIEADRYEVEHTIDYSGKITAWTFRKPVIDQGDYILCMADGRIIFTGICDSVENEDGNASHTINILEIANLFNRNIILEKENIIKTVGIEEFLKQSIDSNFINSDDSYLNLPYINVHVKTNTPIQASVENDNGIFNLLTYMGNALEYYGIFLTFHFEGRNLVIEIEKREQGLLQIDATVTDITNYSESYKVDVLSKLKVIWKKPDKTENDKTIIGASVIKNYYLLNDRTVSTDGKNENRAKGKIDTVFIEKELEEEMYEDVLNQFKSNSYEHSVEASINQASQIYPECEIYVGHECLIKTKSRGIQNSIITRTSFTNNDKFKHVKFGNLPIGLIDKLKKGGTT